MSQASVSTPAFAKQDDGSRAGRTHRFEPKSFEDEVTRIGGGLLGTTVETLLRISHVVSEESAALIEQGIRISIPHMHVIATDFFDQFILQNRLHDLPFDVLSDQDIAAAFVDGVLPTGLVLHLYTLVEMYHVPLAVRASRMTPFPFSHGTQGFLQSKIIPNNQVTLEERAAVLQDAVKLIYASSFYRGHRDHLRYVGQNLRDEKTAIVIQAVIGKEYGALFCPTISGTVYSCNFFSKDINGLYDGSASLEFGLGGGAAPERSRAWCYPLNSPAQSMPFKNARHKLSSTQNHFIAIDLSSTKRDPLDMFEYTTTAPLSAAEHIPGFSMVASTFDAQNDRFVPGVGNNGARVVDFAPLLVYKTHPFNQALRRLKSTIEDALYNKVAISFAMVPDDETGALELSVLQVTQLFVHTTRVELAGALASETPPLLSSEQALGNGVISPIYDIVYVDPDAFSCDKGASAVAEVAAINQEMVRENRRYIFIAMGRIGTSDRFRGLQVAWHQVSGARVFVETDLPGVQTDCSRGNHFFSDLVSCGSVYLHIPLEGPRRLDFDRLNRLPLVTKRDFVKHVRSPVPLKVLVDGRTQRGVVIPDTTFADQRPV